MAEIIENHSEVLSEVKLPFELSSLTQAVRYQEWIYRTIAPFLGRRILEIGAGIGNMSRWMPLRERLILTENSPELLSILKKQFQEKLNTDSRLSVQSFNVLENSLDDYFRENLDTVISFNVLEHIENDHTVLERLASVLRKSEAKGPKRLVTFVPSHSWAYGSLDRAFGHYRRYSQKSFLTMAREIAPEVKIYSSYFNCFGLLGWILNGRVLRKTSIGEGAIRTFETLCPVISVMDDWIHQVFSLPIGQSLWVVMEW